jgi:hypothetical protein
MKIILFPLALLVAGCGVGRIERPRLLYLDSASGDFAVRAKAPLAWRNEQ